MSITKGSVAPTGRHSSRSACMHAALNPGRHTSILREVKLTAKLTHPHILPLIDSGEISGLL